MARLKLLDQAATAPEVLCSGCVGVTIKRAIPLGLIRQARLQQEVFRGPVVRVFRQLGLKQGNRFRQQRAFAGDGRRMPRHPEQSRRTRHAEGWIGERFKGGPGTGDVAVVELGHGIQQRRVGRGGTEGDGAFRRSCDQGRVRGRMQGGGLQRRGDKPRHDDFGALLRRLTGRFVQPVGPGDGVGAIGPGPTATSM